MLPNVGWAEMLVLLVAALVILGPERLPGAISWSFKALRQARDYVTGATTQLRDELGPEFEDLREPLSELNKLRKMNPRSVITKHVLDGDDFLFTGESKSTNGARSNGAGTSSAGAAAGSTPSSDGVVLGKNETPPVDPDAT
ncbi:Sec-independent protein translocase protein TatB [Millisia brevis]|uniref:Sec-independent protein translocase protein TatB n=1 Tax=Millisia brevis TaxID=264148 RepID=UPI000A90502D|nr:Sec-independent protein translocase protein TatB [Millisia brevis]